MAQAERDDPVDPIEPEPVADLPGRAREKPQELDPAAVSPENAPLLAEIERLTAMVAARDAQLNELCGQEWLALRACDRGGFTIEAVRKWCESGLVVSRREGTGKRAERIVNTRSLAARLAQKGLSKAIRSR